MTIPSLLKLFFWFGAVGPLPSIVMYLFFTAGTVEHFNGEVSPTSLFWCSTCASADATVSFLCFAALWSEHADIHKLVLRAFAVYAVFHWGSCWWWSVHGDAHPAYLKVGYPLSIGMSLAAMTYWSILKPLKSSAPEWTAPTETTDRNGLERGARLVVAPYQHS